MEKRFILAVVLSFGVLYFWGLLTQKAPEPNTNYTQTSDKEQVVDAPVKDVPPSSDILAVSPKEPVVEAQEYTLESDELKLVLTDRGAAVKEVFITEYQATLPIANIGIPKLFSNKPFVSTQMSGNSATFEYDDEAFKVIQSYKLNGGGYILNTTTRIFNKSEMSKLIAPEFFAYIIDSSRMDIDESDMAAQRDKTLNEYAVKYGKKTHRKAKAYSFDDEEAIREEKGVDWAAYRDRYFCAIVKPEFETAGFAIKPDLSSVYMTEEKGFFGSKMKSQRMGIKLFSQEVEIPAGSYSEYTTTVYIGPEEMSKLKPIGLGFEKIKKYYRFGLFDFAGKLINQIMHLLYKIVPNWGACIVILSVLVYFSMYPLTKKSMLSMRKMQAVGPKINALKEKYKDNPQKMNAEMMEIYKKEKINPAGGCLPVLLQAPIFLGLYQVLWRSVAFKGSKFLWINDLTEPDRLFIMPFSIPIIGNEFNLLPILMIIIMYFQQKFSTKAMVTTDPIQLQQQKMMSVMMPFVLGFIFYKFSSGLTLYFTMYYIFSTITQWKMSKEIKVG